MSHMTPERALVERLTALLATQDHRETCGFRLYGPPAICLCAAKLPLADALDVIAALTASRQREEEEAKGEIVRLARTVEDVRSRAHLAERFAEAQAKQFRAENDRLTLAASESARMLQVEIERLKGEREISQDEAAAYFYRGTPVEDIEASRRWWRDLSGGLEYERDLYQAQVAALREIVTRTGAWAHQGCGCEWDSRGERMASPTCEVDKLLAALPQDGARHQAEAAKAIRALSDYGVHRLGCAVYLVSFPGDGGQGVSDPCNCGLDAIYAKHAAAIQRARSHSND